MIRCETKVSLVYGSIIELSLASVTVLSLIKAEIYYLNLIGSRINLIKRLAKHVGTMGANSEL